MKLHQSAAAILEAASTKPSPQAHAPLERMVRIYEALRDGRRVNSNVMAADLEVSARSVGRDIEFMRDRLQLPIEYDQVKHSYYLEGAL